MRSTDEQIRRLKEAIDGIQQGRDVDVAALLGTGEPDQEKEWTDLMREISEGDLLGQIKAREKEKRRETAQRSTDPIRKDAENPESDKVVQDDSSKPEYY